MTTKQSDSSLEPSQSVLVFWDISSEPLEGMLAGGRQAVLTEQMGALVTFDGVVRNHDHGCPVAGLSYSAHPQAKEYLEQVLRSVLVDCAGVRLWAVHRVGPLALGESALTVLAAAAHREQAFKACQLAADQIKAKVPIWKEQQLADGSLEWVGLDS